MKQKVEYSSFTKEKSVDLENQNTRTNQPRGSARDEGAVQRTFNDKWVDSFYVNWFTENRENIRWRAFISKHFRWGADITKRAIFQNGCLISIFRAALIRFPAGSC